MNAEPCRPSIDACNRILTGIPRLPRPETSPDSTGVGPTPLNYTSKRLIVEHRHGLPHDDDICELCLESDDLRPHRRTRRVLFDRTASRYGVEGLESLVMYSVAAFTAPTKLINPVFAETIGSPHLSLLLSGVWPRRPLEADRNRRRSETVRLRSESGRNLRDHPHVIPRVRELIESLEQVRHHSRTSGIQTTLRYTASRSHLRNDMLLHPASFCVISPHTRGPLTSRRSLE